MDLNNAGSTQSILFKCSSCSGLLSSVRENLVDLLTEKSLSFRMGFISECTGTPMETNV